MILWFLGLIGSFLTIIGNNLCFLIGRFFHGFIIASRKVMLKYLKEIIPKEYNTKVSIIVALSVDLGSVISFGFGFIINKNENWWRYMLGFPLIICFFMIFCFCCIYSYDTPHFYFKKGYNDKAKKVLNKLYSEKRAESELLLI